MDGFQVLWQVLFPVLNNGCVSTKQKKHDIHLPDSCDYINYKTLYSFPDLLS